MLDGLIHGNRTIHWKENSCAHYHPNLTKTPSISKKEKISRILIKKPKSIEIHLTNFFLVSYLTSGRFVVHTYACLDVFWY